MHFHTPHWLRQVKCVHDFLVKFQKIDASNDACLEGFYRILLIMYGGGWAGEAVNLIYSIIDMQRLDHIM